MGKMHEHGMFDWGYHTEPEPNLNGRRIEAMRGKVLGGSSSINVMAYTRGHRGDYDRWAQKGARGWSYADVLPYFKRCETWEGGENAWRGGDGPARHRIRQDARSALRRLDRGRARRPAIRVTDDYNGQQQEGFGRGQYTIRNGCRSSAADAPISGRRASGAISPSRPARMRTRVLMQGTRATGVEYVKRQRRRRRGATPSREVILAGGAFNTPQLLMLSGIGPAAHLREMGIKPRRRSAGRQEPAGSSRRSIIFFARPDAGAFRREMRFDRMAVSMIRAYFFGTGPGTVVPGGLHAFIKTRPELAVPDIEFMFRGAPAHAHLWFPLLRPAYADGYGIRPTLLHPDSRGEILLRSTDPRAPPRIVYNFFSAPERSAAPARRLQARARGRLSEAARSLSRRRDLAGRRA